MKVVLISDNGQSHRKITVNIWLQIILPILLLVVGVSFVTQLSRFSTSNNQSLNYDKKARDDFYQILNKLSLLDAEVQRLNALSAHIALKNKLDITNFNLSNIPAQGGAIQGKYFTGFIVRSNDLKQSVDRIERDIDKQKLKLKNILATLEIKEAEESLEKLAYSTNVKEKARKEIGRRISYDFSTPMKKGYISSSFGDRRDPINGSLRPHGGLDIAANKGSNIYAIANGFVSFSGWRGDYGKLLEIKHSESLKSRYAHLDRALVKKGELVKKGDLIGKVGITGRVTGPHLHLEISENKKTINPRTYLKEVLREF